jgi:MFS family permease
MSAFLVSRISAELDSHRVSPSLPNPTSSAKGYFQIIFGVRLLPLWIVTLLFALSISSRLSFVAPFAYERGIARVGTYFAIYAVIGMAVRIVSGRLMDRVGLERTLAPSMVVLGIGITLIAGTGHFALLDLAGAIGGFGHGYVYPALSALVIARGCRRDR